MRKNALFLFYELMKKHETRYKADSGTVKLQGADRHKMHTSGDKNGEKQVGIANQYVSDHLLKAI